MPSFVSPLFGRLWEKKYVSKLKSPLASIRNLLEYFFISAAFNLYHLCNFSFSPERLPCFFSQFTDTFSHRRILILIYTHGVQVWDTSNLDRVEELLNLNTGIHPIADGDGERPINGNSLTGRIVFAAVIPGQQGTDGEDVLGIMYDLSPLNRLLPESLTILQIGDPVVF